VKWHLQAALSVRLQQLMPQGGHYSLHLVDDAVPAAAACFFGLTLPPRLSKAVFSTLRSSNCSSSPVRQRDEPSVAWQARGQTEPVSTAYVPYISRLMVT